MARPRKPQAETPYQRRIRRYLELHPGATRQEARGHKPPPGTTEAAARRERYLARRPGASRAEASGHGELLIARFLAAQARLQRRGHEFNVALEDHVKNIERLPDGRWQRFRKVIVPDDLDLPETRWQLPAMSDARL